MRRTGKDGSITLASGAVASLRKWDYNEDDVDVDTTAAGDDWEDAESLRGKFEVTFEALLEVDTPYVIPNNIRGTKVAFALRVIDTDANGLISGTAKVGKIAISSPYNDVVTISGTLKTAGIAPTWDLSPAS